MQPPPFRFRGITEIVLYSLCVFKLFTESFCTCTSRSSVFDPIQGAVFQTHLCKSAGKTLPGRKDKTDLMI